ncbi:MAG: DUF4124 domain-containing protein [Burkholderiales bacterium]|nr:DUF4124 domain-containing protein [Burkholderiales bacterium]
MEHLTRLVVSILACFCFGSIAYAEIYKCKDSRGVASYKDAPCDSSERAAGSLPGGRPTGTVKVSGLWETVERKNPRISDSPRLIREGIPKKTVACLLESPAKYFITHPSCRAQVVDGGGTCVIEENHQKDVPQDEEVTSITTVSGDYRHFIHVMSHIKSADNQNPNNHWTDESKLDFSYLGPCKSGMWWGQKFDVAPNGEWIKPR